jgi:hypothetical protein
MLERQTVLAGRYRVLGVIGRGGMGVVYRAYDERERRQVAVKTVRRDDRELVGRLRREASLLGELHHPNVVRLLDVGEADGLPFIVTQLVDGTPLRDLLGRMTSRRIAWVGEQVASALTAAHALEIVHRDLKPSNILVGTDIVRLLDFGIARHVDDTTMTSGEALIGTVSYLAPEQISGGVAGPPSDIYALGLVLIECFTGRSAFPGTIAESVAARLADGPRVPAAVPESWHPLLQAMTQSAPGFRPTAPEVVTILRRLGRSPVAGANALALAEHRGANPLLVLAAAGAGVRRRPRSARRALAVPVAAAIGFVLAVTAANAFTVDRWSPQETAATTALSFPPLPDPTTPPTIARRAPAPTPAMPLPEAPVVTQAPPDPAEAPPEAAPEPPPEPAPLYEAPAEIAVPDDAATALSTAAATPVAAPVAAAPLVRSSPWAGLREARQRAAREREARRQAWEAAREEFRREIRQAYRRR